MLEYFKDNSLDVKFLEKIICIFSSDRYWFEFP